MPYLGNNPSENFVNVVKQDITGNGGTSYSLSHPVASSADLEVFVNNVQQEPTTAYTASGSTLTFSEAITSTDDIYVIFRARSIGTATHPSDQPLSATTGTFNRTGTEGSALTLQKDGTTFGTLGVDGSDLVIDGPSGHTGLRMTTSGLLPRQNGAIIDNTIALGSGAYRFTNLYLSGNLVVASGQGIDFSANANVSGMTSELLNDYEIGTFTPSFTGGLTGSSYGDQNGVYTKIGNFVFFAIELDITNGQQSTNGNQIKIDNLPFSSDQNSTMNHQMGGAWVTFNNNFFNVDTGIYMQIGENTNQLKLFQGNGSVLAGNTSGVNSQNDLHVAGCYRTAT